jgi:hypothetical protein
MIWGKITRNNAMTLNEAKASTAAAIALNLSNMGRFLFAFAPLPRAAPLALQPFAPPFE